jgi:SAM-dependent methyltransferase
MSEYILDQAFPTERERLEAMAVHWDPPTRRLIEALEIGPGDHCLEVGAGTGTVARILADLVGPTGRVLAVDLDPRFLIDLPRQVEVRALDLRTDPLPEAAFDLVHARMVVEHIPPQRDLLSTLVRSLRPGGWLLVEDADFVTAGICVPPQPLHEKVLGALLDLTRSGGYDDSYGRRLFADLRSLGLTDLAAEFHGGQIVAGEGSGWAPWQLLVQQFQERLLEAGLLTQEELAEWWELSNDGRTVGTSPTMFCAWGRRPRPG